MANEEYQAQLLEDTVGYIRLGGDEPDFSEVDPELSSWLNNRLTREFGRNNHTLTGEVGIAYQVNGDMRERFQDIRGTLSQRAAELYDDNPIISKEVSDVLREETRRGVQNSSGNHTYSYITDCHVEHFI